MNIEKNIPIPGFNLVTLDLMSKMEIGDSFLIENPSKHARSYLQRFKSHSTLAGKKFITRSIENNLRVWRIV